MPQQVLTFLAKRFHHRVPFTYRDADNSAANIGFVHGFSVAPAYYEPFLKRIAKSFNVVAPEIAGINRYWPQPKTIDEYVEMYLDFFEELENSECVGFESLRGFKPDFLVGHSLGGAIAIAMTEYIDVKAVIAINPLLPVDYGPVEIFRRGLGVGITAMGKTRTGFHPLMIPGYLTNIAAGVRAFPLILSDICRYNFDHRDGSSLSIETPAFIIVSKKDQLFGESVTDETTQRIDEIFHDYEIIYNNYQHDYPLEHPNHAAKAVAEWIMSRL